MQTKYVLTSALWVSLLSAQPAGLFEDHSDVGKILHAGSVEFDAAKGTYTISGSGENMWAAADGFHYVWKKVSGDTSISADILFPSKAGNAHKKAVLMIRQSLDTDSAYVDAAVHNDGLTSLQSRDEKGGLTHEVGQANASAKRVRLEKRGDYFYLFLAKEGEDLHLAGGSMRLTLKEPFYVGIGVCSHDKDVVEKAVFSNVLLSTPVKSNKEPVLYSTLETVAIASTDRRVSLVVPGKIEAPNWTPDGAALIYNGGGQLQRIALTAGSKPETIDTGFAVKINNDHGVSPDGKLLAISDSTQEGKSVIYTLSSSGGTPKRITKALPSYWHGWSPDGKTLTYCGQRDGKFDIYTISVDGGEETQLTKGEGHNDGPEYSPDGKYIYFNSSRTGNMHVWRMKPDGSELEQITSGEENNWFPHISPDGQKMAFITYEKGVEGHPANKDVMLQVMTLADKKTKVVAKLFGGQGTMNVPSWAPNSLRLAFVSYQLLQ